MREITTHVVNPVNDKLKIEVLDQPGAGGANHCYRIDGANIENNPLVIDDDGLIDLADTRYSYIIFQNGGISENGVNGLTQEVLLAIVADRLECFQRGQFASHLNAQALQWVRAALDLLQQRTRERLARGVEGKAVA